MNIWLALVLIFHTTMICPILMGIISLLVLRSVEDEPIPETLKIPRVHYMEARLWHTSTVKRHLVMIPIPLLQTSAVEVPRSVELVGYRSGKASLNTVHLRDATRWHTVPHIYSVCVTEVDIDVRNLDALEALIRQSIAPVMVVVHDASGMVVQRVRYRIRVSVDAMGAETDANIRIALKEPDKGLISVSITVGSIPVHTPTVQASLC